MSPRTIDGRLFGYADVGRFGLGHGMLAWARCIVWCHETGAQPIAPQWLRMRIGPYLRRERDKRFYYRLFHAGSQVGGLERLRLLATAHRISAEMNRPLADFKPEDDTIVEFRNAVSDNEGKHFHEIAGRSELVRVALIDMTRPRFLARPPAGPHIALHVRGGDFSIPKNIEDVISGRHNMRLPLSWYVEMLDALRNGLATNLPAIIYSDCTDAELAPLLTRPQITRSTVTEAITDMLAIANADLLISSGSGFSRWGSYLGQVPRICFPGQRGMRTLGPLGPTDLEPECKTGSDLSAAFLAEAQRRLV
jgi:hypothetical protein